MPAITLTRFLNQSTGICTGTGGIIMTMIDGWQDVARKAWSLRLSLACAVFSGIEAALPMLAGWMPQGVFAWLSFVSALAAGVARVIAQEGL